MGRRLDDIFFIWEGLLVGWFDRGRERCTLGEQLDEHLGRQLRGCRCMPFGGFHPWRGPFEVSWLSWVHS